jgi:uncharacterized protein (DUF362 family)
MSEGGDMPRRLSRRAFLRLAAIGVSSAACGRMGGALSLPTERAAPTLIPLSASATPFLPAAPTPTAVPPTAVAFPDLVVVHGPSPEALVRRGLAALGGMPRFVQPGQRVVIKPNICVAYHSYEYAATTNPWVVGELVRQCLAAGAARVTVMDTPFGGSAEQAYAVSGIAEQVAAAGGEMHIMRAFKYVATELPLGRDLRSLEIYDDVLGADVLINVPIAKHHSLARLTLGMKNLMGVIRNREQMHRDIGQRLADLSSRVRPALTIVDAVRMLMAHGPSGGSLADVRQADTLILTTDVLAADSYAATLFGLQPQDLAYIRAGGDMGLGQSNLSLVRIEDVRVEG